MSTLFNTGFLCLMLYTIPLASKLIRSSENIKAPLPNFKPKVFTKKKSNHAAKNIV